ncbi:MAG: ROK family protein [Candidatus Nanohaloarchaea archaeon]
MPFFCIDIGGTNTLIGVGNGDFEVVTRKKTDVFLDDIQGELKSVLEETDHGMEDIEETAVAAAGPIDREKGFFRPPNIEKEKVQLRTPLEEIGRVHIVNDCTSAVLGEYFYGDHGSEDLVYITISSGIGAGVIVDGNLAEGWNGNFGEVGHMTVAGGDMVCGCGGEGHWEAYCSGNSLPELGEEITGRSFEDAREIFDLYREGDDGAEKVIERMNEINARGLANVVDVYNPGKILLGGAVALNHPEVITGVEDEVRSAAINEVPEIEICSLGEKAVIHGLRAVCNGEDLRGA